ncbi:MFS transporter, partial [Streptomyces fulvissimus]|nr:MFS transporter [Streptomyces microflavus]
AAAGHSGPELYGLSLTVMTGLLVVGFLANELVRPVHPRHHVTPPGSAPAAVPEHAPKEAAAHDDAR